MLGARSWGKVSELLNSPNLVLNLLVSYPFQCIHLLTFIYEITRATIATQQSVQYACINVTRAKKGGGVEHFSFYILSKWLRENIFPTILLEDQLEDLLEDYYYLTTSVLSVANCNEGTGFVISCKQKMFCLYFLTFFLSSNREYKYKLHMV